MKLDWLPKALTPLLIVLALYLFRRFAPAPAPSTDKWNLETAQELNRLPSGVIGGMMCSIVAMLASSAFLLRWLNHVWASFDGPSLATYYAPTAYWWFFPLFSALAVPWPLTIWLLKRFGRQDEADAMADRSNQDSGINTYFILKWMSFGIAAPIGILTLFAIPVHLSLTSTEARVGHYARWSSETFPYAQARRATIVAGRRERDGSLYPHRDLLIDFADGRRLDANAAGDGGSVVAQSTVDMLLRRTGLAPAFADTSEDISTR